VGVIGGTGGRTWSVAKAEASSARSNANDSALFGRTLKSERVPQPLKNRELTIRKANIAQPQNSLLSGKQGVAPLGFTEYILKKAGHTLNLTMDTLVDFLLNFYGPTPYLLVLGILLLCGIGVPIPEDITLFAAGLLAYYGMASVWAMIGVSLFGVMAGDSFIFFLGFKYGRKITQRGIFRKVLPEDRLNHVSQLVRERGNKMIAAARFMPGLRAPIFFTAGTLHLPFRVFFFYDGGAALLSVPLIIGAVYIFGDEIDTVVRIIQRLEYGIVGVIFCVVLALAGKWYLKKRRKKSQDPA
jgi:membrane protein DedA with SNARE-associated domain